MCVGAGGGGGTLLVYWDVERRDSEELTGLGCRVGVVVFVGLWSVVCGRGGLGVV